MPTPWSGWLRGGLLLACGALAAPACAGDAVYHCRRDGVEVYSAVPCQAGQRAEPVPAANTLPAPDPGTAALAHRYDAEAAAGQAARQRADRAWLQAYQARQAQRQAIDRALHAHEVVAGMTPAEVEQSWNLPVRIEHRDAGRDAGQERWIYYVDHHPRTVTFRDGVVTAVHASKRR